MKQVMPTPIFKLNCCRSKKYNPSADKQTRKNMETKQTKTLLADSRKHNTFNRPAFMSVTVYCRYNHILVFWGEKDSHINELKQNKGNLQVEATNISDVLVLSSTANIDYEHFWWIGLNDRATENQFKWSDGTALGVRKIKLNRSSHVRI